MSESKIYTIPDGNNSINPALMMALSQNGGFGGGANWLWPMFMFLMFPWLFGGMGGGFGGFGGFGNNAGNILGTGFLSNQITDNQATDTLLQAINGRADAASQLAQLTHSNVNQVEGAINAIQTAIATVGGNLGLSSQQVINSVQSGNASLSQQLCECCCNMRYDLAQQTNALQAQAAQNASAAQLQLANHDSNVRLQLAQNEAADQLSVCQQTNQLSSQADRNTNSIINAISQQSIMINEKFCDLEKRELQDKITSLTAQNATMRGQIDNANQTAAITSYINGLVTPLQNQVNNIASKQPNTVPVEWPNLTAVNNTPYVGSFGYNGWGNGFWNNGFGGSIVF